MLQPEDLGRTIRFVATAPGARVLQRDRHGPDHNRGFLASLPT